MNKPARILPVVETAPLSVEEHSKIRAEIAEMSAGIRARRAARQQMD